MLLCPADKTGVIVLGNADDCDPLLYAHRAFRWVAPALVRATAQSAAPEPAPPDPGWHRYIGKYRNCLARQPGAGPQRAIGHHRPASADPVQSLGTLTPVAEHTFRHETGDGLSSPGELAVFEVGGDGEVQRLKLGENYLYPVATW